MGRFLKSLALGAGMALAAGAAEARVCDWRLSQWLSGSGETGIGEDSAVGLAIQTAGVYLLSSAGQGAMAAATAGGTAGVASAAAGTLGTVVGFVTAPATLTAGAVAAVGIGALEIGCHFADERITDQAQVLTLMIGIAEGANPEVFQLHWPDNEPAFIRVRTGPDEMTRFEVANLYLVNGVLKHRQRGPDRTIGSIYLLQ
jgi:hypothetical protein